MESRPSPDACRARRVRPTLAEDLPEIYRAILDRVAELERIGARRDAGRIRAAATRAYSDAWDESARRQLLGLLARAAARAGRSPSDRGAGRSGGRSVAAR